MGASSKGGQLSLGIKLMRIYKKHCFFMLFLFIIFFFLMLPLGLAFWMKT